MVQVAQSNAPLSFLPETKGISLEEIDPLFGSVSHKLGGQDIFDNAQKGGATVHTEDTGSKPDVVADFPQHFREGITRADREVPKNT